MIREPRNKEERKKKEHYKQSLKADYIYFFGDDIATATTNSNEIEGLRLTVQEKDKDIIDLTEVIDEQQKALEKLDKESCSLAENNNKLVKALEVLEAKDKTLTVENKKLNKEIAKLKAQLKELDAIKETLKKLNPQPTA
jgi:chromosome segregation ATPase